MVCGQCGKDRPAELERCPYCGTEQPPPAAVVTPPAPSRKANKPLRALALPVLLVGVVLFGALGLSILNSPQFHAELDRQGTAQKFDSGTDNLRATWTNIQELIAELSAGPRPTPTPAP